MEKLKLNEYHQEANRKSLESNKKMPKASSEGFKKQSQKLRAHREAQGN
ncbi:MAG: hypothetical protein AABY93_08960 [Bacteroidota bacterium]